MDWQKELYKMDLKTGLKRLRKPHVNIDYECTHCKALIHHEGLCWVCEEEEETKAE